MSYIDGLARAAYDAYKAVADKAAAPWSSLTDVERSGWRAAVRSVLGEA